jgi:hypothetical protein
MLNLKKIMFGLHAEEMQRRIKPPESGKKEA